MRHLKRTAKLGRQFEHRNAMLANLVCSLIRHKSVTTTLAKAKAARPIAEKMVTLAKQGTIHARRLAVARLHQTEEVKILFKEIAPAQKERNGGYTRIMRLGKRQGDVAQMAIIQWVDVPSTAPAPAPAEGEQKAKTEGEAKPAEAKAAELAKA
ncbi:MAG: 50S ribosomal protein L17 [Verrucomicrobiota bacterium]